MLYFLALLAMQPSDAPSGRTAPLRDGLPTYTNEQAEALRDAWLRCLIEKADSASKYTDDPSNVIVDVAIELCDHKMGEARFAWRRFIVVASPWNLTDESASASADKYYAEMLAGQRKFLLGRASLNKQIRAIDMEDAEPKRRR